MNLTANHIWHATLLISEIIRDRRPMPLRGKYGLARMHARLIHEFDRINAGRVELIRGYNHIDPESGEFTVPPENVEHFNEAWRRIAEQRRDVDVHPIHLADLDMPGQNGVIDAHEIAILDDLIAE